MTTPAQQSEIQDLRARLEEAEETLRAIRSGEVDALVVDGPNGEQIYTLKSAEEPYRVMVEAMTEGAVTFSADGTILYCNARFAELLKLPLEQTIGATVQDLAVPAERSRFAEWLAQNLETAAHWETVLQAADSTRVPVLFSTNPLKGDYNLSIVAAVVTDLSAIAAAAEARSRLAAIVESSKDAIVSTTLDGVVESWNTGAERLFGYTAAEAIGQPIQSLIVPPEHADEMMRKQAAVRRVEQTGHEETVRLRKDGTAVDVSVTASPVRDASGKIVGMADILHDITEHKRLEEQLRQHRDHLEELVARRTVELQQANARLQELDRLKSMFIASMSHELRTPLNSIIGFTGVILQGLPGEINAEQRKQLGIVQKSAQHLLALINDVIDISKIEAGIVGLSLSEFDLAMLAREVTDSFVVAAQKKGVELTVVAAEHLMIESDPRRVRQILVNLVGNAVKFTDIGRIEIGVTPADAVTVTVRDTGIGISADDLPKLFTAFSQIVTEGREKEGAGLGLYLSRRIAKLLGGGLSAQSEAGTGSVFTLSLPAHSRRTTA